MRKASRAAVPPDMAAWAAAGSRPDSMNARRTASAGTSAAAATASTMTPSSAPWRSSPVSSRKRKSRSSAVARDNNERSSSERRRADPLPVVAANSPSAESTSPTVSRGDSAGAARSWDSVRQPTPMRPCVGVPVRKATAAASSSAGAPVNSSARTSTLALRERRAVRPAEAVTTSWSRMGPSSRREPTTRMATKPELTVLSRIPAGIGSGITKPVGILPVYDR